MKYKVMKGSQAYTDLTHIKDRIHQSDEVSKQLVDELGATEWLNGGFSYLTGGMLGIRFSSQPDGWKPVYTSKHQNCFFPKKLKKNEALLTRIEAIPKVTIWELNQAVGYQHQTIGDRFIATVGVTWGTDYHLLSVKEDCEYTPLDGMEEITVSEFNRLKEKLHHDVQA
ncbi:hypothetical protein CLV58_11910 [Spirosoma oryzae]|uniref:Uncharacterized protein n=1 Tax=Spirosoma oryzae TaxID=1469603 RepID=A0A2T0SKC5_9BACT|nr:hypothetical protein [Spirosoma oryzae]PRY33861.1 hypothetical protein CLV58_11910 [Spirosoma oryzae]